MKRLQINESPERDSNSFDYSAEYYYNSFYRFSITNIFKRDRFRIKRNPQNIKHMVFAPYSGLLINLSVINSVGFPLEEMYLYSDDIEYTFRMSESGVDILQVFDANIRDISGSWYDSRNHNVHDAFFEGPEENYRALYAYRNEAYVSKYVMQKSKILGTLNYYAWIINILRRMPKNRRGVKYFSRIIKVVRMGRTKHLGQFNINH